MKISLIVLGKTDETYLKAGIAEYESRINRYIKFSIVEIPGLKNTTNISKNLWKAKEAEKLIPHLASSDFVVLLDEKGKEIGSVEFSGFLNQRASGSIKHLVFVIGGPYGFDDSVRKRAGQIISLSRMTFSHQLVRILFLEQLYRAFTILRNESYHHE